jgi:hypothetical protein
MWAMAQSTSSSPFLQLFLAIRWINIQSVNDIICRIMNALSGGKMERAIQDKSLFQTYCESQELDPVFTLFLKITWAHLEILFYDSQHPEVLAISSVTTKLVEILDRNGVETCYLKKMVRVIQKKFPVPLDFQLPQNVSNVLQEPDVSISRILSSLNT